MPLTPADIHNVAFSKPPIGKRGYYEDEVDAFLDLVGAELARLIEQNNDLRRQVEQRDRQLRTAPVDTGRNQRPLAPPRLVIGPLRPPTERQASPGRDHDAQAAKVLGMAQQIADRLTGEAKAQADGMLGEAQSRAERLLADARAKADDMVNEARTRAETLLNRAHTSAETLNRQAQESAASLERDAARKYREIIGPISQEKNALEKKVDELRSFEQEYRTRVKIYLESQLRELDRGVSPVAAVIARIPVQNGSRDTEMIDDTGMSEEMRWQPAV
ncbi:MAG: DivIVA-like cell division protein Wag31 [Pseudonocardiaceae bacterium]